ncbi:MAG: hypothetical protein A2170_07125 [Deltaproteobacteria bacterium RBG_13_53_10]|nr:MAG: hypothetical protein A2170_07125 [Deltaproteobacteria bacterium RBG_13_53_10]
MKSIVLAGIFMRKADVSRAGIPVLVGLLTWVVLSPAVSLSEEAIWKRIDEGLFIGEFASPQSSRMTDPKVVVVKVDPEFYSFKLLCASEYDRERMAPKKWCEKFKLTAAINAGMYQEDGFTNVGLMKNFNHLNNPRLNNSYKAVLAFNPVDSDVPEIQIIDLRCQDFRKLRPKYQTLVQNIRMISCRQENVWARQDRTSSMAVFGLDKTGKALLVFSEALYSGHDFINLLLSLPLSIFSALYLEGGPEASLFFSRGGAEFERVGIYETGFQEGSARSVARPVPNVIGIAKKRPSRLQSDKE